MVCDRDCHFGMGRFPLYLMDCKFLVSFFRLLLLPFLLVETGSFREAVQRPDCFWDNILGFQTLVRAMVSRLSTTVYNNNISWQNRAPGREGGIGLGRRVGFFSFSFIIPGDKHGSTTGLRRSVGVLGHDVVIRIRIAPLGRQRGRLGKCFDHREHLYLYDKSSRFTAA